jgi:Fe-S-cluster containining protein
MKEFIDEWQNNRSSRKRQHQFISKRIKSKISLSESEELHNKAFEKIDCLQCANCCKSIPPLINTSDISRISKKLGMKKSLFMEEYVTIDEDGDMVFNSSPCKFLQDDNICVIYEVRPKSCRRYPHTDEGEMIKHAKLLPTNAQYCPAVYLILEKIDAMIN